METSRQFEGLDGNSVLHHVCQSTGSKLHVKDFICEFVDTTIHEGGLDMITVEFVSLFPSFLPHGKSQGIKPMFPPP